MATRKFGSRDDLELTPVIRKPGSPSNRPDTPDTDDTESGEDLERNPPQEQTPMLDNKAPLDPTVEYSKPLPKPRKNSNPNLLSQSQKSPDSLGRDSQKPKPAVKPRNQSKSSLLKEKPPGDTPGQGNPHSEHQPSSSDFIRQEEPPFSVHNTTGEKSFLPPPLEADTTSIGDISQVQQFDFIPKQQMGEVDEQPSPTGMLGWLGFGCSVFALTCLCVSFASPYWMQAYPLSFNEFRNMGLWEVCMQDYMHHKDDSMDIYDGCWWVFNRDGKYWKLREWLLPPWFITCQVMVTMNLLCHFATIAIVVLIFLHCCPIINHEYHQSYAMFAASGLCFFITILTLITGIMYALFCGDRNWMPRPDLNFISWGYGFLIIQGIIATAAGVCYFLEAQKAFNELDRRDQEYTKAVMDMEMSQAYPTNYSAGSYGHQSYDQGSTHSQGGGGSSYGPPAYPGTKQDYNSQPSYDQYSTGHSEKGGSLAYSEKPPYPGPYT